MEGEEPLDMDVKPKAGKGRAMTVVELRKYFEEREAAMQKKIDELEYQCDSCSHHECECPHMIEEANGRMDVLDENDEKLRQNINRAYSELSEKLEEEHRLRVVSEQRVDALLHTNNLTADEVIEQRKRVEAIEAENRVMSSQNLKLGVLAGVCLGLCLVVLAIFLAG